MRAYVVLLLFAAGCSSASAPFGGAGNVDGSVSGVDGAIPVDLPDGAVVLADGAIVLPDGATFVPDASGPGHDAGVDAAGPSLPMCRETCTTSADCATPQVALYDANHYACDHGLCAWLGCMSNTDCTSAYQKSNYACGTVAGLSMPSCYETCNQPSDCATPSVALYDANHYACNGGRCQWLGCASNGDCTAAFQKTNYACGAVSGLSFPDCYETCNAPSDCATPSVALYDANHYACSSSRCQWLGCMSTNDCTTAFQKPNYACE